MKTPYLWADLVFSAVILGASLYAWIRYQKFKRERIIWRCVRYYGGGNLETPRPMTAAEASQWIGQHCNAEVGYIDHQYGFIFYRPRGQ